MKDNQEVVSAPYHEATRETSFHEYICIHFGKRNVELQILSIFASVF